MKDSVSWGIEEVAILAGLVCVFVLAESGFGDAVLCGGVCMGSAIWYCGVWVSS